MICILCVPCSDLICPITFPYLKIANFDKIIFRSVNSIFIEIFIYPCPMACTTTPKKEYDGALCPKCIYSTSSYGRNPLFVGYMADDMARTMRGPFGLP